MNRRQILKASLMAGVAAPIAGNVQFAKAQDGLVKLEMDDPLAQTLAYHHNTENVDTSKYPTKQEGAYCGNCNLIQGEEGEEWRPCAIFPGKLINVNGWCNAWVKKVG